VNPAGVAQAPYNYEDRVIRVDEERFQTLCVFVPEPHDWLLMKIARGEDRDVQAAKLVHQENAFDPDLLLKRFLSEFQKIGVAVIPGRIEDQYLLMVDALFGVSVAEQRERAITVGDS